MKKAKFGDISPVYTSDRFVLRLVEEDDAVDLLDCYSDASAVRFMNADNCTSDFYYKTLEEMKDCIKGWLKGYRNGGPVRFSIIDIQDGKIIGTIEMYEKTRDVGILRLDLRSPYESQFFLAELLKLSIEKFYESYGVQHIMVKSIPFAEERVSALYKCGFTPVECNNVMPFDSYYIHDKHHIPII